MLHCVCGYITANFWVFTEVKKKHSWGQKAAHLFLLLQDIPRLALFPRPAALAANMASQMCSPAVANRQLLIKTARPGHWLNLDLPGQSLAHLPCLKKKNTTSPLSPDLLSLTHVLRLGRECFAPAVRVSVKFWVLFPHHWYRFMYQNSQNYITVF